MLVKELIKDQGPTFGDESFGNAPFKNMSAVLLEWSYSFPHPNLLC
jgi:hypothetical protein